MPSTFGGKSKESFGAKMSDADSRPRDMEGLHERAILLWIHSKMRDAKLNPSKGIFFALTDRVLPESIPVPQNAIDLCDTLNDALGFPPLTKEQKESLTARALVLFHEYESGRSTFHIVRYLTWANWLSYALGAVALLVRGLSWWIIGLVGAVWLCNGAGLTAAKMAEREERPEWEVPAIAVLHALALLGLVGISIFRLITR